MKWSFKVWEFRGTGVYVHVTFLLFLIWIAVARWMEQHAIMAALDSLVFTLALFACVLLHEFAHTLAASGFGIRTRDITLFPIGGIGRLERIPETPAQELWVALAGPAASVGIAGALFAAARAISGPQTSVPMNVVEGPLLDRLMFVNLVLAVFNMLPAFPMDGGRVLRALLATRLGHLRATTLAANIGQAMAVLLGFLGAFTNPFLVFIALLVWVGASQEAAAVRFKSTLEGVTVAAAMRTDFAVLAPDESLEQAAQQTVRAAQRDFPVVREGQLVGVLTREDLLRALSRDAPRATVADIMRSQFELADSDDLLEAVFARLLTGTGHTMPVIHGGRLVGLVGLDSLGDFVRLQRILEQPRRAEPPTEVGAQADRRKVS
jgi:Zn-dependent protease/CBS domain-containing protein